MMHALLATLWQSDSAFPSGGFAFSNGIEGAAALDPPLNCAKLALLVAKALRFRWATADRLALLHAYHAESVQRLCEIDSALEAAIVAEPLRTGSRRNGAALLITHARLCTPGALDYRSAIAAANAIGHLPVAQGWLWKHCGLTEELAVGASAYTFAAGMVNAAVRLGGLGAIDAQNALAEALRSVFVDPDDRFDPSLPLEFPSFTPWLDIAAIRHARSHIRLFSN